MSGLTIVCLVVAAVAMLWNARRERMALDAETRRLKAEADRLEEAADRLEGAVKGPSFHRERGGR